jgi:hypothetical protein
MISMIIWYSLYSYSAVDGVLLVHILEVLVLILDVDSGYLVTFRLPFQYIKASAGRYSATNYTTTDVFHIA